ncbi:MAG: AAA family ATPase [Xanthomonadales bacterium]|nr:AAA family ATPase [Xanthomonadales bacterium]
MTLFTKISRLRHPGVLRDFSWPAELPTFGRYNLIYGWNGSGKTTISNMFRALELRTQPEGEATLATASTTIAGNDFAQATLPVRVFNRDFKTANVFPVGGGEVPPIFVLGEESADKQAQAEQLKGERTKAQNALDAARQEKGKVERALDKHCVDRATVIRETLRSSGNNAYNNYDKARYKQRVATMLSEGNKASHLLADDERERLLAQSKATPKASISEVQLRLPDLQRLTEGTAQLMQKSVVSSAITTLKADPQLSSWIRDGLRLHHQREVDHCLFCEQSLPGGRIAELEAHFNTEYEKLLRQLDAQIAELEAASYSVSQASLPNRAELYEDLVADFDSAKAAYDTTVTTLTDHLAALVGALKSKKQKVFESQSLNVVVPDVKQTVIGDVNAIIQRHNQTCTDFAIHVGAARTRLEADSVASSLDEYQSVADTVQAQEAAISQANTKVQQLTNQITRLEREIIEHRQPAEELNQDLHSYLGHTELQLDVKDTGYTISRNGTPARSLSEGEMTAIALLYFLKTLKDRRFEIEKGLVVLDDPVSSLDANALFLAFGFIRRCVDDAGQIVILTHNFAMFRQVRNWFHHLKDQNKNDIARRPARFYMMDCSLTDQGRRSRIAPLDPLLEQFESEYHYLFARVYRRAKEHTRGGLEQNYIFPNMARRLLEAFLAFRRPQNAGDLRQKLQGIDFDETKKLRVLRFLHTHSHADAIVDPEHDPSVLGEAQAVLADLLALIRHEDAAHYDAMVALVDPPSEEAQ